MTERHQRTGDIVQDQFFSPTKAKSIFKKAQESKGKKIQVRSIFLKKKDYAFKLDVMLRSSLVTLKGLKMAQLIAHRTLFSIFSSVPHFCIPDPSGFVFSYLQALCSCSLISRQISDPRAMLSGTSGTRLG